MIHSVFDNLSSRPDAGRALDNYPKLAPGYDRTCTRIEGLRLRAVRELALRPGETVFDVACGTGPTLPALAATVAPAGTVVGIELCHEMAVQANRRIATSGQGSSVKVLETAFLTNPCAKDMT